MRHRYKKRPDHFVTAVQLNLEMDGFAYKKWGAKQQCRQGDWLVYNEGDTYTVNREIFAKTYQQKSPGVYVKITPVWAELTTRSGSIVTTEGKSNYQVGDYLVCNCDDSSDIYPVSSARFESMYELDE
ncbi:MAG: hypothetical protein GXP08_04420 [Gammaproteobacteria bacterium]|nr:hypothetical protein [Gammaproteobacteria bacterium]